jgi:chromosome segregation ATPase
VPDSRTIAFSESQLRNFLRENARDEASTTRAIEVYPSIAEAGSVMNQAAEKKRRAQSELAQLTAPLTTSFDRVTALHDRCTSLQSQVQSFRVQGVSPVTVKVEQLRSEAYNAKKQISALKTDMQQGKIDMTTFLEGIAKCTRAEFVAKALAEEIPGIQV